MNRPAFCFAMFAVTLLATLVLCAQSGSSALARQDHLVLASHSSTNLTTNCHDPHSSYHPSFNQAVFGASATTRACRSAFSNHKLWHDTAFLLRQNARMSAAVPMRALSQNGFALFAASCESTASRRRRASCVLAVMVYRWVGWDWSWRVSSDV